MVAPVWREGCPQVNKFVHVSRFSNQISLQCPCAVRSHVRGGGLRLGPGSRGPLTVRFHAWGVGWSLNSDVPYIRRVWGLRSKPRGPCTVRFNTLWIILGEQSGSTSSLICMRSIRSLLLNGQPSGYLASSPCDVILLKSSSLSPITSWNTVQLSPDRQTRLKRLPPRNFVDKNLVCVCKWITPGKCSNLWQTDR